MSLFWVRLTSPLWVPVLAISYGVWAAWAAAIETWHEVWS